MMADDARAATAVAHLNIALVKHWGKRDAVLNLPGVGSRSATVDTWDTRARVRFVRELATDVVGPNDTLALAARTTAPLHMPQPRQAGIRRRMRLDGHVH